MKLIICTLLFYSIFKVKTENVECRKKIIGDPKGGNIVCVCNETYCDTIHPVQKVKPPNFIKYTSNKAGLRFEKQKGKFIKAQNNNKCDEKNIKINRKEKYQKITGWGGAFTDSTGINIKSLPEKAQEFLLRSYFSQEGLEYSLARVPIGGTDFSTHSYSYDNAENDDPDLEHFSLVPEDFNYKLPFIQRAQELSGNRLKLFASVWTAPVWIKTNNKTTGFGFIKPKYYRTWANYFLRFLEEYDKNNVSFWGVTTGNEPSLVLPPGWFARINNVGWTPITLAKWIANDLGPVLRNSKYSKIKLMALDDQRPFLPVVLPILFLNPKVKKYVDGIAVHWYLDSAITLEILTATHKVFPDKFILYTEACEGFRLNQKSVELGSWERGENYISSIIQNINHWVTGWTDWNMALDLEGGPTYIKNNVDSPIIVNASGKEFYKQPMYYGLGHFSKFVPPDSQRIGAESCNKDIEIVVLVTPDKSTVIQILNKKNENLEVSIQDESRGTISTKLTPKSITTIIYW